MGEVYNYMCTASLEENNLFTISILKNLIVVEHHSVFFVFFDTLSEIIVNPIMYV